MNQKRRTSTAPAAGVARSRAPRWAAWPAGATVVLLLMLAGCTADSTGGQPGSSPAPPVGQVPGGPQPGQPPVAVADAIHVSQTEVDVPAGQMVAATASCQPRDELVGGGYLVKPASPRAVRVVASYPSTPDGTPPPNGADVSAWTVQVSAGSTSGGAAIAFAECAHLISGAPRLAPRAYVSTAGLGGAVRTTASCPGDGQLTGGGFGLSDPFHNFLVYQLGSFPDAQSGGWTVFGTSQSNQPAGAPAQAGVPNPVPEPDRIVPQVPDPIPARFAAAPDPDTLSAYAVCANRAAVTTSIFADAGTDLVLQADPTPSCIHSDQFALCTADRPGNATLGCPAGQRPLDAGVHIDELADTRDDLYLAAIAPVPSADSVAQWSVQADDFATGLSVAESTAYTQDRHVSTGLVCATFATISPRLSLVASNPRPGSTVRVEGGAVVTCVSSGANPTDLVVSWQAGASPPIDRPVHVSQAGDPFSFDYTVPVAPAISAPDTARKDVVTVRCRDDGTASVAASATLTLPAPVYHLTAHPQIVTPGRPVRLTGEGLDCPATGGPAVQVLFDNQPVPVPAAATLPATAYDQFSFTIAVPTTVTEDADGVRVALRCLGSSDTPAGLATVVYVRAVDLRLGLRPQAPKRPGDALTVSVHGIDCAPDGVLDLLWNGQVWATMGGITDRYATTSATLSTKVPSNGSVKPGIQTISVRCHNDPAGNARPYPTPVTFVLRPPVASMSVVATGDGHLDARMVGMDCSNQSGQPDQLRLVWADTQAVIVQERWTDAYRPYHHTFGVDKGIGPGTHTITAACVGQADAKTQRATVAIPGIDVTPRDAPPEAEVTIRGYYFACPPAAGRPAAIQVGVAWPASIPPAAARQGMFQIRVRVPRNANPGGTAVTARCTSGGLVPRPAAFTVDRPLLRTSTRSAEPGAVVTIHADHFPYSCQNFLARIGGVPVPIEHQQLSGDPISGRSITGQITIPHGVPRGASPILITCADPVLPLIAQAAFTVPAKRDTTALLLAVGVLLALGAGAATDHLRRRSHPHIRTRLTGPSLVRVEWGHRDDDH
jgi:hypothetical protein